MNRRKIAILDMQIEVSQCLHTNALKYKNYKPLEDALLNLDQRIAAIKLKQKALEEITKAYAIDKKKKRLQLALLTDAVRKKVQAVMLSHKNDFLYAQANITRSDITAAAATKAVARAGVIYDLASAVSQPDKTLFNILQPELDLLQQSIIQFDTAHTARRNSAVEKQTSGSSIDKMIKDASVFIRTTIHALMGNYLVTNEEFFNEMAVAQRIINPASKHAQITGKVVDAVTEQPLQRVRVKATNGATVYEDMTDKNGIYKIPVNPEVWNITFELNSYNHKDFSNIIVDSGERQRVNTALSPA